MAKTTRLHRMMSNLAVVKGSWDSIFLRNLEDKYSPGEDVLQDPYAKSDLVYVCISTTQRAVSQVPIVVYYQSKGKDGKTDWVPAQSDDAYQRLFDESPSPVADPYAFKESIVGNYLLDGFVAIVPFPPKKYPPDALYVIPKKYITPIKHPQTKQHIGWKYQPGGDKGPQFAFELSEVVHLALWSPDDPIMGVSPMKAAARKLKIDYKATVYNEKFFDNGAVPHGVLTVPEARGLGDKTFTRLQDQIEGRHTGFRSAHRMMILEEGLQYTQTGLSQADMQFVELSRLSREAIMQCLGMKKTIISVIEDVNRATAEAERKEWWKGTIIPTLERIAFGLTQKILLPATGWGKGYLDFDTSGVEALQEDYEQKVRVAGMLSNLGFTANEINQRLELGFESKPWRDVWYIPVSLVPVGEGSMGGGGAEAEGTPPSAQPSGTEKPQDGLPQPEVALLDSGINKGAEAVEQVPAWEKRADVVWKGLVAHTGQTEDLFQRKVSRFFYDLRQRSLKHLLSSRDIDALRSEEFKDEQKSLAKWLRPLYYEGAKHGIESAKTEIGNPETRRDVEDAPTEEKLRTSVGIDFTINDPAVAREIEKRVTKITGGGGLTGTIKDQIKLALATGVSNGEGIEQLADRVRSLFTMAATRAKTIARTEVAGSANLARGLAIDRSNFKRKIWYTAGDERVRGNDKNDQYNHVSMNGKKTKVGTPWKTPGGSTLDHPADYAANAPGDTINCRCIEVVDPDSYPE